MKKYIFLLAVSCFSILNLSSKPIDSRTDISGIEVLNENYNTNNGDEQCVPSWKWIGDDWCNINVRVDNPCSQRAYFYIVLNNCTGNCVRCYFVNPGSYITQAINWCDGGTFYWGVCP